MDPEKAIVTAQHRTSPAATDNARSARVRPLVGVILGLAVLPLLAMACGGPADSTVGALAPQAATSTPATVGPAGIATPSASSTRTPATSTTPTTAKASADAGKPSASSSKAAKATTAPTTTRKATKSTKTPTKSTKTAAKSTKTAKSAAKSTKNTKTSAKSTKTSAPAETDDRWEMVPMPKLADYNSASITNSPSSSGSIKVCRDWSGTACTSGTARGTLAPGENSASKFGWKDTDAYNAGTGWVKQGGCFGCAMTIVR
jgi:outer membrane biosynthesis protein TonB